MAKGVDLDAYVRETLLAIVGGVLEAQKNEQCGHYVGRAPAGGAEHLKIANDLAGNTISLVKFDLATTVEEKSGARGGGSIKVVPFVEISGEGRSKAGASTVSRLQFSVPVSVPVPEKQRKEDEERRRRMHGPMRNSDF